MHKWWYGLAVALFSLAGCATDKPSLSAQAEMDYNKSKSMVEAERFAEASVFLEHFTAKHPYSKYTPQAELLRVYASYMDEQEVLSEVLAERFLEQHPTYADRDYAMYMLAMSHYKERASAERDASHTTQAIETFNRLIKEYPQSPYAADGKRRLQQLHNELAGHELSVARYYFNKRRFVAAANRAQVIVTKFQTSPQIEEALYLLAASYQGLEMQQEATETAQLLHHNYPNSEWNGALSSD